MADLICDDTSGRHWIRLQNGLGYYTDLGYVKGGYCNHRDSYTQWADLNGDGTADMLCDDNKGRHWAISVNK